MKKLLSILAVSAILGGTAAALPGTQNESPALFVNQTVKRAPGAFATEVVDTIREVIASNPSDFYISGDQFTAYINQIEAVFHLFEPSQSVTSAFITGIEELGALVTANNNDYLAARNSVWRASKALFEQIGIQYSPYVPDSLFCALIFPASTFPEMPKPIYSFSHYVPLPLDLKYPIRPVVNGSVTTYIDLAVSSSINVDDTTVASLENSPGRGLSYIIETDYEEIEGAPAYSGLLDVQIVQRDSFFKKNRSYKYNLSRFPGSMQKATFVTPNVDEYIKNVSIVSDSSGTGSISFDVVKDIPEETILFDAYSCGTRYASEMTQDQWKSLRTDYNNYFVSTNGISQVFTSLEVTDNTLYDGQTKNIYLDVDNNYTEAQILAEVAAEDLFGVSVPVTVKSSDYEVGKTGIFNIILEATDTYGQKATATLIVNVIDYAKPVITKNNDIVYTYGTALTEAMLLQNFTFSDNMGTAGLTYSFTYPTGFDISQPLVFGNYSISVTATDAFGNATTLPFNLSVVDETAPIITKKDGQMSDKVGIGYSALNENTVAWILNLYKATDAIDGNCLVYLKEGKIPSGIVGDFTLTIAAKDKSNNEALATITCEIIADIPPVFILSDKLVNSTVNNPLTLEQVEQVVKNGLLRSVRATNVTVNAAGYLANSTKVGSYPVSYSYTDMDTGETNSGSFIMKVSDNSDLPIVDEPKEDNFFIHAFKTIFSSDINKAAPLDWFVVIVTIVLPLLLLAVIVGKIKG